MSSEHLEAKPVLRASDIQGKKITGDNFVSIAALFAALDGIFEMFMLCSTRSILSIVKLSLQLAEWGLKYYPKLYVVAERCFSCVYISKVSVNVFFVFLFLCFDFAYIKLCFNFCCFITILA